jgi:hypothetical protein
MGGGGGQSGNSDSSFSRHGGSSVKVERALPDYLTNLITGNASEAAIGQDLAGEQNSFLSGLLNRDNAAMPGINEIAGIRTMDPGQFGGLEALTTQANRDPYNDTYATETQGRFDDSVQQAVAASETGAERVRGGQAHQAMATGEAVEKAGLDRFHEVSQQQRMDAETQQRAAAILNQITQGRMALKVGAQQQWAAQFLQAVGQGMDAARALDTRRGINTANLGMASEIQGTRNTTSTEDLDGHGSQASEQSGWGAGISCCWIFLQAYDGELPWFVRRARDMFCSTERRDGYNRMAKWLVPKMRKSRVVTEIVRWTMTKPLAAWGAWYYGEKPLNSPARFLKPVVKTWFKAWDLIGGIYG